MLTPRRITHPYLGSEAMNQSVVDILRGVFDPDCVISQLGRTGSAAKEWLRDSLLSYLQDSGIRFQSEKSGNDQKKTFGKLKPAINDIVMYVDSEKRKRFAVITNILEKNQVELRSDLNGTVVLRIFHIRVLILLYRAAEWCNDISQISG